MSSVLTHRPALDPLDSSLPHTHPRIASGCSLHPPDPPLPMGTERNLRQLVSRVKSPRNGHEEICLPKKSIPTFEPTNYKSNRLGIGNQAVECGTRPGAGPAESDNRLSLSGAAALPSESCLCCGKLAGYVFTRPVCSNPPRAPFPNPWPPLSRLPSFCAESHRALMPDLVARFQGDGPVMSLMEAP